MALQGEWWILPEGEVLYADGEIGDVDHVSLVLERAATEVLDALEAMPGEWAEHTWKVLSESYERFGLDIAVLSRLIRDRCDEGIATGQLPPEASPDPLGYLIEQGVPEVSLELLTSTTADERRLAMKHWGWIRLRGSCVTLWGLSKAKLDQLAEGLYEVFDEAVYKAEFCLEDAQTNIVYALVPWAAIDGGDVGWIKREKRTCW